MVLEAGKILFWGPQSVSYWNQYFCAPVYERLKPFGWKTSYYFPPVNEFGSGLNKCWRDYYPDYFESYGEYPNYNILDDIGHTLYWYNDPAAIADALKDKLSQENPDVIITRVNGHDYLKQLFPGTPILTMGEAMGSPWFNQECFALSADPNFHGLPHLCAHPEQAVKIDVPYDLAEQAFDLLPRMKSLPSSDMKMALLYFEELRKKYDRIYLFPADYTGPECLHLFTSFTGERFATNADVIHWFKHNTDEKTALLVTSHPLEEKQSTTSLSDIFHPKSRIITADSTVLNPKLFRTSLLTHLSDGLIVRNSKAFWYALVNNKPLLNLGSQNLSAAKAFSDLDSFLNADTARLTKEEAVRIFYWQTTRFRIALRENKKISQVLMRIIEKAGEYPDLQTCPDLYEWGTEQDYLETFEYCTRTHIKDFYYP